LNLRPLLLPGLLLCPALVGAAAPPGEAVIVNLEGQRKFLDASIAFCVERIPDLKADFARARDVAAREIGKAESIIANGITPTLGRDRPLLDMYNAAWSRTADDLVTALKKQNVATACPTLRDNWLAMEADVIVEDWEMYLERNRQQQ
jgi:hypothetical protein